MSKALPSPLKEIMGKLLQMILFGKPYTGEKALDELLGESQLSEVANFSHSILLTSFVMPGRGIEWSSAKCNGRAHESCDVW